MTRSRMTIDFYLKQAGIITRQWESKKTAPSESVSSGNFGQMLSALTSGDRTAERSPSVGKTITDYMASRVPVSRFSAFYSPDTNRENTSSSSTRRKSETTGTKKTPEIDRCIKAAAEKYNLSEALIESVIEVESGFRKNAVSSAGAKGLMQLMPATAKELGVTDAFDVEQNIDGGAKYLRQMLDRFNGDTKLALSAYNAGPGTVKRYKGNVPYKETRHYVKRVIAGMSATDSV